MQALVQQEFKATFATHTVPLAMMAGVTPLERTPQIGDLALVEVLSIGQHTRIEDRDGIQRYIFPGDRLIATFGNRYATDQFEGYVPNGPVEACDLLSIGGVCGIVTSQHEAMKTPTRVRIHGLVCDADGTPINARDYGLPAVRSSGRGETILVVGASMNAGKTTTVGTIVRALKQRGKRVAAAKVTGTAASKDGRFIESCGATPTLDFTDIGYPATYMLSIDELMDVYERLGAQLRANDPDYIVLEIADGIYQRETRMLLEHAPFRATIDHVFFAVTDSLAAECAVRCLRDYDLPLRAFSGAMTQSPLMIREAEAATGVPCLSIERMLDGGVMEALGYRRVVELGGAVHFQPSA
jgi:hypothetical protein